jgi:hypothetical protein
MISRAWLLLIQKSCAVAPPNASKNSIRMSVGTPAVSAITPTFSVGPCLIQLSITFVPFTNSRTPSSLRVMNV